jgi:hypothetical protein
LKSKRIYLPLIIGLVLVLSLLGVAGCQGGGASGGNALFSDDFSRDTGDWEVYSDANGEVFYEAGWLHVINYTTAPIDTVTFLDGNFSDFVLEIETKLVDGTDDNWHGVVCRYQDDGNFYVFNISADGYYYISRFLEYEQLALSGPTFSDYINLGWDVVNTLYIECDGNRLKLSVNGHQLTSVTDSTFSDGALGLLATSWAGDFSEIAYDNLVINEP